MLRGLNMKSPSPYGILDWEFFTIGTMTVPGLCVYHGQKAIVGLNISFLRLQTSTLADGWRTTVCNLVLHQESQPLSQTATH